LSEQMEKTLDRGCEMVKELLSFARKSESRLLPTDLTADIRDTVNTVMPSLPENIRLRLGLKDCLPEVFADVGQIDRVVTNLIVNARDAMPDGGILQVSTDLAYASLEPRDPAAAKRKAYVRVSVADTGIGMDEETRARMFEPFFTTKGSGLGTGLGLSVVCGLMENHHGFIDVQSKRGEGTTVSLFFPVMEEAGPAVDEAIKRESREMLGQDDPLPETPHTVN
ncbi:MAG TPA: ATP-binding protein, partial [Candidatus Methylacidiphilales bacterium]|nr:ATP-binding protein [Candidatus Methylacidiphilales bacterium]